MIIAAIEAQEVKRSSAVHFLSSSILCDTEPINCPDAFISGVTR